MAVMKGIWYPTLAPFIPCNINEYLGKVLQEWRQRQRLSVEELSRRTEGEVSARHIRRIEAGQSSASYDTFFHIRLALGVSTTEMFMPYFLYENQIPLFSGQPVSNSDCLSVQFTPGRTIPKYEVQNDPALYAVQLEADCGPIPAGSILQMSPNAHTDVGSLVLEFLKDNIARLFRLESASPLAHRVVLILPK